MTTPKPKWSRRLDKRNVRFTEAEYKAIQSVAADTDRSASLLVRHAVQAYLKLPATQGIGK